MKHSIKNKYVRLTLLLCLSITIGVGSLFTLAALHHSEPLSLNTLAPVCAQAVQQIHYPESSARVDDCAIRHWYNDQVKNIPETLHQQALPMSEEALCAYSLRHQMRMAARDVMPSGFEVSVLRVRDFFSYGHFDGPAFSQLAGAQPSEVSYHHIITSASKTDVQVNQVCEK